VRQESLPIYYEANEFRAWADWDKKFEISHWVQLEPTFSTVQHWLEMAGLAAVEMIITTSTRRTRRSRTISTPPGWMVLV
jgi:hypothetical protein